MPANVARLFNHTKASQDGVNKKILVHLEAAPEVSSSRKNVGNREDNIKKAAVMYIRRGRGVANVEQP